MSWIVDASVAIKVVVAEEDSDAAHRLAASDDTLHAPRLMVSEIANTLWRKARVGDIEPSRAGALMTAATALPDRWHADETVGAEAVRLAIALDRPVYDCVYLALAYRLNAQLVTADRRFANALAPTEHGYVVTTLAEYAKTYG